MVILIDEMEAHLHPPWQRIILPALLDVSKDLASDLEIQFIITTHSPLVMTSAEPHFKPLSDKLFYLYLEPSNFFERNVRLEEMPFIRYGVIASWLTSHVFALSSSRSLEAEDAIAKAFSLQRQPSPDAEQIRTISAELQRLLAADDHFCPL